MKGKCNDVNEKGEKSKVANCEQKKNFSAGMQYIHNHGRNIIEHVSAIKILPTNAAGVHS